MTRRKEAVVTFKADAGLLAAMKGVANRSQFIRDAVLAALESVCPLCSGTGIMTPRQRKHWETFAEGHSVRECEDCHELHLVCARQGAARRPGRAGGQRSRRGRCAS